LCWHEQSDFVKFGLPEALELGNVRPQWHLSLFNGLDTRNRPGTVKVEVSDPKNHNRADSVVLNDKRLSQILYTRGTACNSMPSYLRMQDRLCGTLSLINITESRQLTTRNMTAKSRAFEHLKQCRSFQLKMNSVKVAERGQGAAQASCLQHMSVKIEKPRRAVASPLYPSIVVPHPSIIAPLNHYEISLPHASIVIPFLHGMPPLLVLLTLLCVCSNGDCDAGVALGRSPTSSVHTKTHQLHHCLNLPICCGPASLVQALL